MRSQYEIDEETNYISFNKFKTTLWQLWGRLNMRSHPTVVRKLIWMYF